MVDKRIQLKLKYMSVLTLNVEPPVFEMKSQFINHKYQATSII